MNVPRRLSALRSIPALPALVASILLLVAPLARADDESLSSEHARRARAYVITSHLKDAILEYDLAWRASPQSKYLFNIAELHRRLAMSGSVDELRRSLEFFARYLALDPGASDHRLVESRIVELRAQIAAADATAQSSDVASANAAAPGMPAEKLPPTDEPASLKIADASPTGSRDSGSRRALGVALGIVGGAVAVALGVGLGVGLSQANLPPPTSLGDRTVMY